MNMHWIDWSILFGMLTLTTALAIICKRYTVSVADFLSANRCAGRYLLCSSSGMSGMGAISVIAMFEMYYQAGFTAQWWMIMMGPLGLIIALSGWVAYRLRETRALTMAQFFEMRYSKRFRVFAGILAWSAGILNFGIFPSVGARFFIHFCGLPATVPYLGLPMFPTLMFLLLAIAVFYTLIGGQIAVMITDFMQGMFTNVALLVILGFMLITFDWNTIIQTLMDNSSAEASRINPFHTSKVDGFNYFYFLISMVGMIYSFKSWQGSQGYNSSAKSAHEAKMAGILGEWRALILTLLLMLLPIGAFVIMHHPSFVDVTTQVNLTLDGISTDPTSAVRAQMIVPIILAKAMPVGIVGLFAAVMLAAFISTHDTYLHSWGSIFIQDVILPFRKKPFSPENHILLLRISVVFVAVFIFFFSLLFKQNQYILMFFAITGAIWSGGAGACLTGGLYWKRGSTPGAWVALITGSTIAVGGMILKQTWAESFYPWMESSAPWLLHLMTTTMEGTSNLVPGINWVVGPEKFPIEGQWILFFAIVLSFSGYVTLSLFDWLVLKKPAFDMDHLLHRGKYAVSSDHETEVEKLPTGLKAILPSHEFTLSDKWIYYFKLIWVLVWWAIFMFGTVYSLLIRDFSDEAWASFWWWRVVLTLVFGIATTAWFFIGGIIDIRELFKTLRTLKRNDHDVGMVVNHHDLSEEEE